MPNSDAVEPLLSSIAKAERHIASEYGTQMVGVMDTIGAHPHFAMPLQPGKVAVLSGRTDIDAMYKASVDLAAPQASRLLSQLATDWFVFIENVPTRLWIESGELLTAQTVTMFVTDDANGITGEYAWQRCYPPQDSAATGDVPLPERQLDLLERHQALLDAIGAGDARALEALLEPACTWAQRDYLASTAGGKITDLRSAREAGAYIARWHTEMQPEHVTIINRRVTDWFVFSEELWVVRPGGGERRQCRIAMIYPVSQNGLFEGALGFGLDIEAPSPSAGTRMGLSFWPQGVTPDPENRAGYPEG